MGKINIDFNSQFLFDYDYYLKGLDLQNWYRYYFIIKEIVKFRPKNILEIGTGNEIVKNCLSKLIKDYKVMDINSKLKPDIISDLGEFHRELTEKFSCIICADVLEHTPFGDLEKNLTNIYNYLDKKGKTLITIPHRRINFIFLNSFSPHKPHFFALPSWFCLTPRAFYSRFIKKETQKDPYHCWEIGDGKVKRKDVESFIRKAGFKIDTFMQLFYVDFWVLKKKTY